VGALLSARWSPKGEFRFDQTPETADWPEMDQAAGQGGGYRAYSHVGQRWLFAIR
jgi:hypothetical protein